MAVQSLSPALRVSAWLDRDHSLRCSSGLTTTVSNHAIAGGMDILPPTNFYAYCHSSSIPHISLCIRLCFNKMRHQKKEFIPGAASMGHSYKVDSRA